MAGSDESHTTLQNPSSTKSYSVMLSAAAYSGTRSRHVHRSVNWAKVSSLIRNEFLDSLLRLIISEMEDFLSS